MKAEALTGGAAGRDHLVRRERRAGVCVGRSLRGPGGVVMPAAVRSKVEARLAYGAEVVLHGVDVGETFARWGSGRARAVFAHPFDDPDVIAGHGSLGLEIPRTCRMRTWCRQSAGRPDSGVAAALKEQRPGIHVYGVSWCRTPSAGARGGRDRPIQPQSVADGLGRRCRRLALAMCRASTGSSCSTIRRSWLGFRRGANEAGPRAGRSRRSRRSWRPDPDPGRRDGVRRRLRRECRGGAAGRVAGRG